jgi:cyclohexa-1,5-dienecarbonyl-CoA hydratase
MTKWDTLCVWIMTSRVTLELNPPVAYIALRHAALNIIDIPMMKELSGALAEADEHRDVSTIIFRGEGKCFSAGVDVAAHTPELVASMLREFHGVLNTIVSGRKVTIAQVHGNCLGGGAELAMLCDMAFTAENATWGFPEIKLGCYPPAAVTVLAAVVGQKMASELILTGRNFDGAEAVRIGLANRSVAEEQLPDVIDEVVAGLSKLSPAALAIAKSAMYAWNAAHFDKGLERAEKIYLEDLMKTEDAHEGIAAFLEKRKPVWTGK